MSVKLPSVAVARINVFLYLRTSTDEQDESPQIQEKRAREFCEKMGWAVLGVYYDILSGTTPVERRPKLQEALNDAQHLKVSGIVGLAFDRFLRSTDVKAQLERRLIKDGLFIWGIDDNLKMGKLPGRQRVRAMDKAAVNVKVAMDQYFRDFISDKIADHHEVRTCRSPS